MPLRGFSSDASELVPQRKLNQARIDRRRGDHPKDGRIARKKRLIKISTESGRQRKLRMVEQIEELRTELDVLLLTNARRLRH